AKSFKISAFMIGDSVKFCIAAISSALGGIPIAEFIKVFHAGMLAKCEASMSCLCIAPTAFLPALLRV
ncbi:MAG: hypothetical protein ACLGIM_04410, partial [Alphaproteobacteria bacterium]